MGLRVQGFRKVLGARFLVEAGGPFYALRTHQG